MLATFGIIVAAFAILIALDPPASIVDGSPYEKFNEYIALGIMCLLVWVRWLFHSQTRRDDRPPPD